MPVTEKRVGSFLEQFDFGDKIRKLRLSKNIGLVELGQQTGLSAAMLSKLENNLVVPTLQSLSRIAMAFSIDLSHFFDKPEQKGRAHVTRASERNTFEEKARSRGTLYSFQNILPPDDALKVCACLAKFHPGPADSVPLHDHGGQEIVYVLSGKLGLLADGDEIQLDSNDSVQFDSSQPHGYRRIGSDECRAIIVTIP